MEIFLVTKFSLFLTILDATSERSFDFSIITIVDRLALYSFYISGILLCNNEGGIKLLFMDIAYEFSPTPLRLIQLVYLLACLLAGEMSEQRRIKQIIMMQAHSWTMATPL